MIQVRPYSPADEAFIMSLAHRLDIGRPPWHDEQAWLAGVHGWLRGSIAGHGTSTMVFVAEDETGRQLGFVTVGHATHFTGEPHASVGELAVAADAEGRGVGKALLAACDRWAVAQGYRLIALTTGASNSQALGFYHHLGYGDEDVKLVRQLTPEP